MNPHFQTLVMIKTLIESGGCPAVVVRDALGVSEATLKRYVSDARHLGAEVVSIRDGTGWGYRVLNGDAIRERLDQWINLEVEREMRSAFPGMLTD